jgi:heat-inducible transcriptional repressor
MQAQGERVVRIMELIEEGSFLPDLFAQALGDTEDLRVFIGMENRWEELQEYSVVIGRYGIPGNIGGVLGVFGPTRMPYPRAIASVRFFSGLLSEIVSSISS